MCQMTNRNLQDKINELQSSIDDLKNKINLFARQNDELKTITEEQKNQLKSSLDERDTYIKGVKKLNNLLEKYKSLNDNNIRDKEKAKKEKDLLLLKYQQNERDKDNILLKNNQLNKNANENKGLNNKLLEEKKD